MSAETLTPFDSHLQAWTHQVMEGKNSFVQIADEKIQEIYALAYMLYQNQQYEEASHFFRLLVVSHPNDIKFWKGLGASLQMQKDYEGALQCYQCCMQDQPDPYLHVQIADCYFALKQIDEGLNALNVANSNAKKIDDIRVLQHVAFMRKQWSKKSS